MQRWTQQRSTACANLLGAISPCDGQTYNGGHTVFADDCGSTSCSPDGLDQLCAMDAIDDRIFNDEFAKVGLVQNPDKAISHICLHSAGSLGILRALNRNHGIVGNFKFDPEARCLGPWLHPTGGFQFEMKRRIKAMNKILGNVV